MRTETQAPQESVSEAVIAPARQALHKLAWSEMLIIVLVAWLGEYASSVATVTPALVDAWTSWLGADNATAGLLATSGLLGQTIGLIGGVLLVSRWPLAKLAWLGLLITIPSDAVSTVINSSGNMLVVRLVQGLGTGFIMAAAINWMGRHQQTVRAFAVFVLLQAILPRAFLNLVPLMTPLVGHASVYVGLIVWALTCTVFVGALSRNGGGTPIGRAVGHWRAPLGRRISAVSASALFNFGAIGMWAFLMRYAQSKGLSAAVFLQLTAWSAAFGILGSWVAFALNTRVGRTAAIFAGYGLVILNTLAMVTLPVTAPIFAAEMFTGGFAVSFLLPHLLATQSALDTSGRLPIVGLIVGAVGASLGPMAFGFISQRFSYATAFAAVAGLWVIGCFALVFAARYANRSDPMSAALTPT